MCTSNRKIFNKIIFLGKSLLSNKPNISHYLKKMTNLKTLFIKIFDNNILCWLAYYSNDSVKKCKYYNIICKLQLDLINNIAILGYYFYNDVNIYNAYLFFLIYAI